MQVLHKTEDTTSATSAAISSVHGILKMPGKSKRAAEVEQVSFYFYLFEKVILNDPTVIE